ncbi:asparagine synthetase B [Actinoplanes ianthinogenes]|uniref:asparagine synthase (glutamine-hydrolyzing) n=1 Tax=Actinoplanes ianthinogenes TaxID=122358 RepID=A0ABM7M8K0_9ACTN|nr:asparagine synthase (glutamine-hydrolyzing) [Actinoplanes ianthinogenes]BCJ47995.1 asparagine synthetase B [Actinoplanes ianthinogenes]GGR05654.1 asparagine synthetase B [Actinoplanes ianthinogenes]
MSGLAAWVDFGRQDVVHPATVREMARRLRHRGPDGEGEWSAPHVAFAVQRLAAVDPAGSAQPAVAPDRAVLMLDGMIYNHEELRRDLHGRGHWYRGGGDAEVALAAYVEWGADFASRLEGMFAIVVWDPRREELLLVRDRLGVKPLCYTRRDAGLIVGSEPKALFAHPAVDPVVDADGLRELFAHGKLPGTTVFQDIFEVRPGHCVRFGSRGLTQQRYWNLEAAEHHDDLPATVGTVRRLLSDAVATHRRGDVPVDAMLSGGIDSSALTALAARHDAGLRSYSVNFAGYTENFEPHPTMRATPDAPYAAMVAEHVGTRHTEILVHLAELTDPGLHRAAMAAQDAPSPLGDMDASLLLFFRRLGEQGRRAVLSGETADEVFDGYFWAYDPQHSNSATFPWVSFERGHDAAVGGLGCSLIDLSLRKELDFLGYADGHYRDALAEVSHLPGATPRERRAREVTYLALTRWAPTHLDRADRLSMAAGVQLRPPFCDRRLIEYVYNVPAALKRAGGREKGLLREAVGDLLPAPVLERRKSAYPTIQESAYGAAVRSRFAELANDRNAAVAPLLDPAATTAALAAVTAPEGAFAWVERASMEMVLQLDAWLTDYAVTLRV